MEAVEKIVEKLIHVLNADEINKEELEREVELLTTDEGVNVKILDFEYYNEERHQHARNEKIESVKAQNFELAASWRLKEKEAAGYLEIKEEFEITKSKFYYQEGYLLYFYLGTEKNDRCLKEIIKQKLGI